jgi:hypothetical protein
MKILTLLLCLILISCANGNSGSQPAPQQSCGFAQDNRSQRISLKSTQSMPFFIDESAPAGYETQIQAAMDVWNTALGRKVFSLVGRGSFPPPSEDGKNVIYWMNDWATDKADQQADTSLYVTDTTITEADIKVNAKNNNFSSDLSTGTLDVESLFVHELGHVLGFKHATKNPSVMAPALAIQKQRTTLTAFDLQNLKCEYP